MTDLLSIDAVFSALEDLRARRPLVHNITNYVAMSVSANAGAVAAQRCQGPGHLPAQICDALYRMDHPTLVRHARLSA